ncbi:MAG: hypothetical protein ABIH56_00015 [Candidatus Margulisiibacteriota bacterium]
MKNLKIERFLWIILGASILFWLVIAWVKGVGISDFWGLIMLIPEVVTADTILFWIFAKWGWKHPLFQGWLVPFPNLNGTWEGTIQSTWIDPQTRAPTNPINASLTIKQSFLNMSCVMKTAEMTSYSYAEDFRIDEEKQIKQLIYSYNSHPKLTVAHRSPTHEGTIVFNIEGNPANRLDGHYWTARKTNGEIILSFKQRAIS